MGKRDLMKPKSVGDEAEGTDLDIRVEPRRTASRRVLRTAFETLPLATGMLAAVLLLTPACRPGDGPGHADEPADAHAEDDGVRAMLVSKAELAAALAEMLPALVRYPALDAGAFERRVHHFLADDVPADGDG